MKRYLLLILCICLTACATPAERFKNVADSLGFHQVTLTSGFFKHRIYSNIGVMNSSGKRLLHVYLDGDGTPWIRHRWLAGDPTSRNPLILELLANDKNPAILLGRPCYHGLSDSVRCHPRYWTSHRYSAEVVASMVQALMIWLKNQHFDKIVLIGYSGGGVLAMLMAPDIPQLEKIVTIAANLDVAAWSHYHGYPPLSGSLNPAVDSLPVSVRQIHLAGKNDQIVPWKIIKRFTDQQDNATLISYPQFDHQCCWVREWPVILELF